MAKKKKTGKQQQAAQGRTAPGANKPSPVSAANAAQQQKQASPAPPRAPLPPLFTPVNIICLGVGLALLGAGVARFWSIQFGGAPSGWGAYFQGFLLFLTGVLVPCAGIAPLRAALWPRRGGEAPPNRDGR
jgi:hypothetical protein